MKTTMQELIYDLKLLQEKDDVKLVNIESIISYASDKLKKEKEQIQKAFSDGQETPINHPNLPHYSRDEYYNDNYNQKELIILDFDKVQKEWIEEANGMTDLEKVKYYLKKIQENENR
jgi:hypothetical protein